MAITKTTTVQRCEVYPATGTGAATNEGNATVMVVYQTVFDDSSDADLPETSTRVKHLNRFAITVDEEGTETSTATDVTGEDQLVQDICAAIWTD